MDADPIPRRSWLAALLMVLLAACGVALVVAFWKTLTPPAEPATQSREDDRPHLTDDEALQFLGDPDASSLERAAATEVVAKQGAKALPQLVKLLDHPSLDARMSAVVLLGRLGPDAVEVAPRLQALCTGPEPLLREVAVPAVMRVHRDPQDLRDTLREALALGPEPVSLKALYALAQLDPPPVEDFEHVATTAENSVLKDSAVRYLMPHVLQDRELLRRLLKHGVRFPGSAELSRHLEEIVHKESDDAIHLTALLQLAPPGQGGGVGDQNRVRQKPGEHYWQDMADAAKRHRDVPEFERVISRFAYQNESDPILKGLLESKHHATRCLAALMLTSRARDRKAMLPLLRKLLQTDAPGTYDAVHGLRLLGDAGKAALPELVQLARGSTSPSANEARRLLSEWGIDPDMAELAKP